MKGWLERYVLLSADEMESILKEEESNLTIQHDMHEHDDGHSKSTTNFRNHFRSFLQFLGPGSMIAVGYMDPGNWAADLGAGAEYNYTLLSIVLFSGLTGMFLQYLSIKLGVVTRCDLAQISRLYFPRWLNIILYIMAEIAIMATDLAEVIGSAIALNLLFGLPLFWGVLLTAVDVLVVLQWWGRKYLRWYEVGVILLVLTVGVCFGWQLALVQPVFLDILSGFLPSKTLLEAGCLRYAIAIMGATVMPHNLYLHSSIAKYRCIQLRRNGSTPADLPVQQEDTTDKTPLLRSPAANAFSNEEKAAGETSHSLTSVTIAKDRIQSIRLTLRYATVDCVLALTFALLVNATILIVGAAALNGHDAELQGLSEAYHSLASTVGPLAATLFAIALLTSGQSSTVTGTMAGQVVMTGYLGLQLRPWIRRLGTRLLAIIPAMVTVIVAGEKRLDDLLLLSQVILSLQLPFAVLPLIWFTSSKRFMQQRSLVNGGDCDDDRVDFIGPRFINNWLTIIVGTLLSILVVSLNFAWSVMQFGG